jgi:hypothetical protein
MECGLLESEGRVVDESESGCHRRVQRTRFDEDLDEVVVEGEAKLDDRRHFNLQSPAIRAANRGERTDLLFFAIEMTFHWTCR